MYSKFDNIYFMDIAVHILVNNTDRSQRTIKIYEGFLSCGQGC